MSHSYSDRLSRYVHLGNSEAAEPEQNISRAQDGAALHNDAISFDAVVTIAGILTPSDCTATRSASA
jgi:hypothetical protein